MSYKVLVVDDSAILRMAIKRAVCQAGVVDADIFEAGNGQEALDVLADQKVDLVLLDLNMPVMSGYEMVAECAKDPILKNQRIVIVTTEVNKRRLDDIRKLGVHGVLHKPFEPEDLREMVGGWMGGRS